MARRGKQKIVFSLENLKISFVLFFASHRVSASLRHRSDVGSTWGLFLPLEPFLFYPMEWLSAVPSSLFLCSFKHTKILCSPLIRQLSCWRWDVDHWDEEVVSLSVVNIEFLLIVIVITCLKRQRNTIQRIIVPITISSQWQR